MCLHMSMFQGLEHSCKDLPPSRDPAPRGHLGPKNHGKVTNSTDDMFKFSRDVIFSGNKNLRDAN